MPTMQEIITRQQEITNIYKKLNEMMDICEISDFIENLDGKTTKDVLKKFIYCR